MIQTYNKTYSDYFQYGYHNKYKIAILSCYFEISY